MPSEPTEIIGEGETPQPVTPPTRRSSRPQRRRGGKWGYAVLGVVVLLVIVYLVYRSVSGTQQKTTYQTSAVTRGTLTVSVSGNGSAQTLHAASVAPGVSGKVTQLQVAKGSYVKQGQVLFVLDNPSLDANVAQQKAQYKNAISSVERAEQSLLQAEIELQKAEDATRPPSTEKQLEAAEEGVDAAQTGLSAAYASKKSAKLAYQQAQDTAAQRTVTAPISGYVTTLNIQNGDQTSGGSTGQGNAAATTGSTSSAPMIISDLSNLQAVVQIAETDRPKVKAGQKASVTFDAVPDLTISGKVASIDAVGTSSQNVVTYNVTISFDVQDKRLSPAMTAAASVVTAVHTDVLLVPNAAVKTASDGSTYVQVLASGAESPTDVTVTTGAAGDSQTEITEGVKEGDRVVTQATQAGTSSTSSSSRTGAGGGLRIFGGGPGR